MGCHTWTYKKCKAFTPEEKNKITQAKIQDVKDWWGFKQSREETIKDVKKWFNSESMGLIKEMTPENYADNMINDFKTELKRLEKEGFDAVIDYEKDGAKVAYHNGEYYYEIGFDDPCRVYGYPNDKFTDKKSLLDWLKTLPESSIGFYKRIENDDEDVDDWKWIEGYTDELVNEINAYFAKHGEDNLYIEFG